MSKSKRDEKFDWLRLDNAAKIFPAARSNRWNNFFRCSVVLKSRIDKDLLQEAVEAAIHRYPMLQVSLRKGIFWYYFQYSEQVPKVMLEEDYPCSMANLKTDKLLFRVLYSRNRISVEFFHSLTDGFGGVNFLNTVLLKYFHLQGKKIPCGNILHYDDIPDEEEFEDSYSRYTRPEFGGLKRREKAGFHLTGTQEMDGVLNVVQGEMSLEQLKIVAKSFGATVSQFIIGIVSYICYKRKFYSNQKANRNKVIKIQTAANLRRVMPSRTLRNFSAIVNVELDEMCDDNRELTFEEVLARTTKSSKEMAVEENFYKFINSNIALEKNPFVRIVPLFLKSAFMKMAYYKLGENLYTISVSNMGSVSTPESFKNYVDRYEFIIGAQKYLNYAMTVATFNDKMVMTISRRTKSSSFEREMFRFMTSLGLDVKVNSNKD